MQVDFSYNTMVVGRQKAVSIRIITQILYNVRTTTKEFEIYVD